MEALQWIAIAVLGICVTLLFMAQDPNPPR